MRLAVIRALPLAALPLVASCVAPKEVAAPAPPAPPPLVAPPAPVVAHDWTDGPLTPGAWTYAVEAGGSAARYVAPSGELLLALRCAAGDVTLVRGPAPALVVTTTSVARTLAPVADGAAHLPARDAFLDAMAFSRGRLMVRADPLPTIVVPVQAEIGRVVEDCRG